ncbi:MAG: DEAD/DEAH box helicase, partial [Myxococcales bacterium]|nr:DEAD/DEAH box helicase [Myxococcales bacterium]
SGKTEAFLFPILDHVLRAKRRGLTGMKALILYPMNALANDQAQRLASILTSHDDLAGVTAAIYTGEQGPQRSKVSADGLITRRDVIRSDPPDILLTNYKMLDQLLLRNADADIWAKSAASLQYLVLDEFHTYDGAQGTDVSMLLRRLGLALKSYWPAESFTEADRARPLGTITPVATSATLGDKGDPAAMLEFARTVFGEEFEASAVITES